MTNNIRYRGVFLNNIEIINLVPRFLNFYDKAIQPMIDEEQRWALWEQHYNFAAVPPGDAGRKIARSLFEQAWPHYDAKLESIKQWKSDETKLQLYLKQVKSLLKCFEPINLVVIYFVGAMENNAFVAPFDEKKLALCLPIEDGITETTLVHELTHVVHTHTANLATEWERTIGSTILQEGLATQISKYLVPGKPDYEYIEYKEGWLDSCIVNKKEIFKGAFQFLNDSSSEAVEKFTFGTGTTQHEREAYFMGWEIVQLLLKNGMSFSEMASVQERDIPDFIGKIFPELI
ncbi:hypothetical protein PB01_08945 [Psychrobacillus glaciei]|uniref:Uncharacterized protein n=1 Tax=Psychrobacillus glaciei TaxID=2283160 RepID=A0A5J6SM26_9BACI|nr:hypothetical protein PB01_08945 [Psychrobacillus glaciei]